MSDQSVGAELASYYEASHAEMLSHAPFADEQRMGLAGIMKRLFRETEMSEALTADKDVAVIAEHKRRSPREGEIRPDSIVTDRVEQYQRGGAAALSILTQNQHFGGSLSDIADAWDVSRLPILRKDFLDDERQLHESKAYGAAAVLLIVAGLTDVRLRDLTQEAERIGIECLVEVHDASELKRALRLDPKLIGVNNRSLDTTSRVDLRTARELIPLVPDGIITVAESGYSVREPDHIQELRELGADAVLMGTALMREENPADALAQWLATDRPE